MCFQPNYNSTRTILTPESLYVPSRHPYFTSSSIHQFHVQVQILPWTTATAFCLVSLPLITAYPIDFLDEASELQKAEPFILFFFFFCLKRYAFYASLLNLA